MRWYEPDNLPPVHTMACCGRVADDCMCYECDECEEKIQAGDLCDDCARRIEDEIAIERAIEDYSS